MSVRESELTTPPGPDLAAELAAQDLADLSDAELVDFLAASRRLTSWAQARELAAAAELARRRPIYPYERELGDGAYATTTGEPITEFVVDEVRTALTLTANAAFELIDLGLALDDRLPATRQALHAGHIDLPKTRVIARATTGVTTQVAGTVEARVLPSAPNRTTGELRADVTRAVLAADPGSADRRRKQSEATRCVSLRQDDQGTATLAGWNLPADQAIAAANRLNAIARAVKADGDGRRLDNIRADVFLAILLGLLPTTPTPQNVPSATGSREASPSSSAPSSSPPSSSAPSSSAPSSSAPSSSAPSGATLSGTAECGFGPCDCALSGSGPHRVGSCDSAQSGSAPSESAPSEVRPWYDEPDEEFGVPDVGPAREAELVARVGTQVGTVNLTIPFLTYVGLASHPGAIAGYGPVLADVARLLAESATARDTRWCVTVLDAEGEPVAHGETRYRPSAKMQAMVECRDQTCRFPGCRRPAYRCDLDHTIPHDRDGPTCPCNLAALCRRHHRLKQRKGWELHQMSPGVLLWVTPTGHWHLVRPDPYARV